MNRIEALENVLRTLRENATPADRQAIDSVLDAHTGVADFLPGQSLVPEPYGWLRENMMLITNKDRAMTYQAAGQPLIQMYDVQALIQAEGRAADRETMIAYLHGRVTLYKSLYDGAKQATSFRICNCGFTGELLRERCGQDNAYFAVRCPDCRKSVQAFTEAGLPQNWNAVNRKHIPLPPEFVAQPELEEMPAMTGRRPYGSMPSGDQELDYVESDNDWLSNNPGALTWLADNHAAIRSELGIANKLRQIAQGESDRAGLLLDALQECEAQRDELYDQVGRAKVDVATGANIDAGE